MDPPNFDPSFDAYENKTQPWMDLSHLPPSVIDKNTFNVIIKIVSI